MRELDAALLCYLEHHYSNGSADERLAFRELLDMPDPEVMRLIAGKPLNTYPMMPEPDIGSSSSNSSNSSNSKISHSNTTQGRVENGSDTRAKADVIAGGAERTPEGAVPLPEKRYGNIIEKIRTTLTA